MRVNCLTRALDQWNENRDIFRLFYNSDHVISLETWYNPINPVMPCIDAPDYLPLQYYGYEYFLKGFELDKTYDDLLREYFQLMADNALDNEIYKFIAKGI